MSVTINGSGTITSSTGPLGLGPVTHTTSASGQTAHAALDDLVIDTNASTGGVTILGSATSRLYYGFGDTDDSYLASINYNNSTNQMEVFSNNLTAATIDSSADWDFQANALTTTGVLDVSGGAGITFDSGSNHFDDYEEGTVVATITPGTSGTITLNASYDELQYTKIGNICHIQGQLITTSVSSPVGSHIRINLPFTSVSGLGKRPSISISSFGLGGGATYAVHPNVITEAAAILYIYLDASTVQASDQFYIGGSYTTA